MTLLPGPKHATPGLIGNGTRENYSLDNILYNQQNTQSKTTCQSSSQQMPSHFTVWDHAKSIISLSDAHHYTTFSNTLAHKLTHCWLVTSEEQRVNVDLKEKDLK